MSKNKDLLKDFTAYCEENPEQRFWQALRNWCGASSVLVKMSADEEPKDTYYLENKQPSA